MKRRNYKQENEDNKHTLSELPDCLLIHILSFLNIKEAVQTCILSSRWEHLWKHLTALTLNSSDFMTLEGFMEFVIGILSLRDHSTPLKALDFKCQSLVEPNVLESIYAASHNVNCLRLAYAKPLSPSFLLSCQSLTSLDIGSRKYSSEKKFPNSLNLPALTDLKLHHFAFYTGSNGRVEPFSTFNRLNTLFLYCCNVPDTQQPLCISSTTLLNLTIYSGFVYSGRFSNIELFAPSLSTFAFTCNRFPKLTGTHLSSIEQVSIDVRLVMRYLDPSNLLNFLIELANIKSLTITPKTLWALSLIRDILKLKLASLCNLKLLNLMLNLDLFSVAAHRRDVKLELAVDKSWKENAKLQETVKAGVEARYSSILDGMIEFLLQNSPSAKVDIILKSEIEIY